MGSVLAAGGGEEALQAAAQDFLQNGRGERRRLVEWMWMEEEEEVSLEHSPLRTVQHSGRPHHHAFLPSTNRAGDRGGRKEGRICGARPTAAVESPSFLSGLPPHLQATLVLLSPPDEGTRPGGRRLIKGR